MMIRLLLIGWVLIVAAGNAQAETTKKKAAKKSAAQQLSTDISFGDSTLHGRYQTPDEASARVENEKSLDDVLKVRTNFKDRLKKASEQN